MSVHLSARQISECLMGDGSAESRAHLLACPACGAEFERMRGALGSFRTAARGWSREQMNPRTAPVRSALPWRWPAALVTACVLLLALAMHYRDTAFGAASRQPVSDSVLPDEVNLDVLRRVPLPLSPLQVPADLLAEGRTP